MPIVVECPSCQSRLKVPDAAAGKSVKCPKCATVISVPLAENEPPVAPAPETATAPEPASAPEETPAANGETDAAPATAAPKKSGKMLYIGLAVGAVVLLSCCCLGIGGPAGYYFFLYEESNPKVTKENFEKIQKTMTIKEVEDLLGPGRPTRTGDVKAAYAAAGKDATEEPLAVHGFVMMDNRDFCWRNSKDCIFITFSANPRQDKSAKVLTVEYVAGSTRIFK